MKGLKTMKTVADLKRRIKLGLVIKTDFYETGQQKIRTVDKVQTNAFTMNGSWLDFPPVALIEFVGENIFKVFHPKQLTESGYIEFDYKQKGNLLATYEILN